MKTALVSIGILVSFLLWNTAPHEVEEWDRLEQNNEVVQAVVEKEELVLPKAFGEDIWSLGQFLESYDSPLVGQEKLIIETSEEYGVDWKMVVAIMCAETSCGKVRNYEWNIWGYGVTSDEYTSDGWMTFEEALHTFCKSYSVAYGKYGSDVQAISDANYNYRDSWVISVTKFYDEI